MLEEEIKPNQMVRIRENPGIQGVTTGRVRKNGSILFVEVKYGPNEVQYEHAAILEIIESNEDIYSLLEKNRFGRPEDLRRTIIYEKIKGDLTNIFYSMESSKTDFYPHQFKPVLKFIESPYGRLLIADEVGLGKTIEAVYIWKELQAREDARRLLIVCPAMLRDKWKKDLFDLFHLEAQILNTKEILKNIQGFTERKINKNFIYISSLEGLRPPRDYEDIKNIKNSAKFARIMYENSTAEETIFDLVIIDEAHYLRNPETSNHKLGRLLGDASKNMILLTATPIQISSDNLFNILKLVDPDQFENISIFNNIIDANKPIVAALRSLWKIPPDYDNVINSIKEARSNDYFKNDPLLLYIDKGIKDSVDFDNDKRVEFGRLLESRSIIGQYMVRSRKRDVLTDRVLRAPQTISINFSDYEIFVYQQITNYIRKQYQLNGGIASFSLVMRQRQMASCMVAAIKNWNDQSFFEEMLWEDLGKIIENSESKDELHGNILLRNIDLKKLEGTDQKYNQLVKVITGIFNKDKKEKFVLFAFFRGTLEYLEKRLENDGIKTCLIMGGMDDKNEIVDQFKQIDGPNVLLSSEVGSEGIDLQFCHYLINYDLPWNPMKVEQRIGRLDRLGQKAKQISIINIKVEDTIEDRIIMRLYDRIHVFEETIGDLEEILGDMTDQLVEDLLRPDLSDEQREQVAEQNAFAIINKRDIQNKLEDEAANLVAFTDYITDTISDSKNRGRWLSGNEFVLFVKDFFDNYYPGTVIINHEANPLMMDVSLSDEAKRCLNDFVRVNKPLINTSLYSNRQKVTCVFDFNEKIQKNQSYEFIDFNHPIIKWIKNIYDSDETKFYSVSSIIIPYSTVKEKMGKYHLKPGYYGYFIHRWSFSGMRKIKKLVFGGKSLLDNKFIDKDSAEELISLALHGEWKANPTDDLPGNIDIIGVIKSIDEYLFREFNIYCEELKSENESVSSQQEISVRKYAERRIKTFRDVIDRFNSEGKQSQTHRFEGLVEKEKALLNDKLYKINRNRYTVFNFAPLAGGIIIIRE